MATLQHIRKRIKSVKNTQKITKAMKMVAAAKLRRAQQAMLAARPYSRELNRLLAAVVERQNLADATTHPLVAPREKIDRTVVIAFTSDRGLCGGFNSNVVKATMGFVLEEKAKGRYVEITTYGRKGRDVLTAKGYAIAQAEVDVGKWTLAEMKPRLAAIIERYERGEVDRICLVYNRFVSAISQQLVVKQLLPFEAQGEGLAETSGDSLDYEYEPTRIEFVSALLAKSLFSSFYLAYLESLASELGARMSAMDSATNNASEMIRMLTLKYNRARQAAITLELMDIVNGSESIA